MVGRAEIVGSVTLAVLAMVGFILMEPPSSTIGNWLESFGWIFAQTWRWPGVLLAFGLLYGAGVNAMYSNGYIASAVLYFIAITILTSKCLAAKETMEHKNRGAVSTLILIIAVVMFAISLEWDKYVHLGIQLQAVAQPAPTRVDRGASPKPETPPTLGSLPPPKPRQRPQDAKSDKFVALDDHRLIEMSITDEKNMRNWLFQWEHQKETINGEIASTTITPEQAPNARRKLRKDLLDERRRLLTEAKEILDSMMARMGLVGEYLDETHRQKLERGITGGEYSNEEMKWLASALGDYRKSFEESRFPLGLP